MEVHIDGGRYNTGAVFEKLTIEGRSDKGKNYRLTVCECGNYRDVSLGELKYRTARACKVCAKDLKSQAQATTRDRLKAETGSSIGRSEYMRSWKKYLARFNHDQKALFDEIMTGRRKTDTNQAEAVDLVMREAPGAYCENREGKTAAEVPRLPPDVQDVQFANQPASETNTETREEGQHFHAELADAFVLKSISQATRRTYRGAIKGFFQFLKELHPSLVTSDHIIAYRDYLLGLKMSANTVALKLSVIRSYYDYLKADGLTDRNPASTRLVAAPPVPDTPAGRALMPKEVRDLLSRPNRTRPEGARDYALMLLMLRLSLRVTEACTARLDNIRWTQGRWTLKLKVKRGREEVWPLPPDVKQAIDDYLDLDHERRDLLQTGGPDQYIFQPRHNFRTRQLAKPISARYAHKIVGRWAQSANLGSVSPHDLRRTVITKLLNDGRSYREVQMVTKHRDPRSVQRYDHARENLERNPVNTLSYEEDI
jgi:integrase/recombinase XerD